MEDISLHILDIVENSVTAGASLVTIVVREYKDKDTLTIEIDDNGQGMSETILQKATDPFYTQKTTRKVGLGLSLLRQAAEMANGSFSIESKKGKGTSVRATFQYSHIDRQPLGDMEETIKTLVIGNPHVDFHYEHDLNGKVSIFDTRKVREELSGKLMSSPQGIKIIKKYLKRSTSNLSEAKSK